MADRKLIEEVGKYIDRYYEPARDDIKIDKEMLSVFEKITRLREKRAEGRNQQGNIVRESCEIDESATEQFDISTMQKTKITHGMSSAVPTNRNIDDLMNQLEETFGSVNHYDSKGHKVGESRPGIFGGVNHYDNKGQKKGHSNPGFFGSMNHYDD